MLEFLSTATVADVAEKAVARTGGARKERNPQGLAIRVFRDGSVYPSQELVNKFSLEYVGKDDASQGNGLDVVDTSLYPTFQTAKRILITSPVSKTAGKVDLFGSTTYNEDGSPKTNVLSQGAKTFGKESLLPLLEEVYGVTLSEEVDHVDLVLVTNPSTGEPWGLPEGKQVTFLPKKVSRGKDKGSISVIRRERPQFWALLPSSWLEQPQAAEAQPVESEVTDPVEVLPEETDVFAGE